MKNIVLHICCGVCAFYPVKLLKEMGFNVEGFFFNPNIYPPEEYLKRKRATDMVSELESLEITEGNYEPSNWLSICGEYKDDKEGGWRCQLCYRMRLNETYQFMRQKRFDCFTTTLTISPHKNSITINEIGKNIGEDSFLPLDLKKNEGFRQTIALSKQHNLYHQNYCGCIYSMKEKV